METGDLMLREATPGDDSAISSMFEETFHHRRAPERWSWQYKDHPSGRSWVSLAESDSRLIGHHGLVRQHLCHRGREIVAAQECDAMIHADARGKQVYTRLASYAYERAVRDGLAVIFSFPSRNSFPGSYPLFMRRLDFQRVANLSFFRQRIGWARFGGPVFDRLGRVVAAPSRSLRFLVARRETGDAMAIEVASRVPDDLEETLKQIRDYEVVAVWKDLPYLRWRYERHPENRYLFHVLRVNGRAEGLVVARDCGRRIAVCEVLHRRKDVVATAALLRGVVSHYGNSRAQHIEFYGHDNGFFDAAFRRAGFDAIPFSRVILVARAFGSDQLRQDLPSAHNWSLAHGDLDAI